MTKAGISTIGILGTGMVGRALCEGFLKHGFEVMVGSRNPSKLADWPGKAGTFEEAARFGQVLVLACKGLIAEELVASLAPALAGKTVLDATNPIAADPPEQGVLRYFTGPNDSLMERLITRAPEAHFVKAFSCIGSAFMVDPPFAGGPPTMFICGESPEAKAQAKALLVEVGWDVEDMGGAVGARAIEPLAMLWCIPGLRENRWMHAFKLLRL